MKLYIITINYNGSEDTIKLLESLSSQTDREFEIIVVDNASEEADYSNLVNAMTANVTANVTTSQVVTLVRSRENVGFSGGNNIGIQKALENGADWVVLLNNDTWVENDFIARLRAVLSERKGIVGLAVNEGGHIAFHGKVRWLKPTLEHVQNDRGEKTTQTGEAIKQVKGMNNSNSYIIGGAMAVHKDVFDKVGLLDEKYFLYFEDADYSERARKAGISASIAPEIMIYHNPSSTTKKLGDPLLLRYHYRNAFYFNLKNGPWYVKVLVWPWSISVLIKQIIKIFFMIQHDKSVAIFKGVFDFYLGRMGKISFVRERSER